MFPYISFKDLRDKPEGAQKALRKPVVPPARNTLPKRVPLGGMGDTVITGEQLLSQISPKATRLQSIRDPLKCRHSTPLPMAARWTACLCLWPHSPQRLLAIQPGASWEAVRGALRRTAFFFTSHTEEQKD